MNKNSSCARQYHLVISSLCSTRRMQSNYVPLIVSNFLNCWPLKQSEMTYMHAHMNKIYLQCVECT